MSAVTISRVPTWFGLGDTRGNISTGFSGEAVALQVSPGKYLFAVLEGYGYETAWSAFLPARTKPRNRAETGEAYSQLQYTRTTRVLPPDLYPLLVTFDDVSDPLSLKRVERDDLISAFGEGYSLKSVELTITDEPVTEGVVQKILPWLDDVGRERGTIIPNPPRRLRDAADPSLQYLGPLKFSTELYK
nr:hypothetical protein [Rhizobium sp. ACO-34A]